MTVLTKGQIGKEDFSLYAGSETTFTRENMAGGSDTLHKIDWPGVDVLQVYGDGDTKTDATLQAAIDAASSNNTLLWLSPVTWTIGAGVTVTVPANCGVVLPMGISITDGGGDGSIVFNGPVYWIDGSDPFNMTGTGTVTYGTVNFPTVASATSIVLDQDVSYISGTTTIQTVTGNSVRAGNKITLHFADTLTLTDDTGNLNLAGSADQRTASGATIEFLVDASGDLNQMTEIISGGSTLLDNTMRLGRATYAYVSTTQLSITGGGYSHFGTKDQILRIDGTITHTITGSETSDWQYIYCDDSAIVTAGTNVLTGSEIINSTTEPTYSAAKRGWYNGNDLCIFAGYEDGSGNLTEFFNDGGSYIGYADKIVNAATVDPDTTWTDVTLTIPSFSTQTQAQFAFAYVDGSSEAAWRTNGQTGTTGHTCGNVSATATSSANTYQVTTDSTQKIEIVKNSSDGNLISVTTHGFYLPAGM